MELHSKTDRKRRLKPEQRRERIISAATTLFAERGYHGTSMGGIAASAGITAAVIYDHFSSKAELHIMLLEQQTEQLLAAVGEAVARAPAGLGTQMRAGVTAFFGFVEEHPYAWRMLFRDPPAEPDVFASHQRMHQQATEGIALLLKANAPEALLRDPEIDRDAEMFAQMLKTAQNGLAVWWYDHRDVAREEVVNRLLEFCWLGLERYAEGERLDPG